MKYSFANQVLIRDETKAKKKDDAKKEVQKKTKNYKQIIKIFGYIAFVMILFF